MLISLYHSFSIEYTVSVDIVNLPTSKWPISFSLRNANICLISWSNGCSGDGKRGKDLLEQVLTFLFFIIFVMPSLYIAAHDNKRILLSLNQPHPPPPIGLSSVGFLEQSMGARNPVGIGLWYRPSRVGNLSPSMGREIDSRNRVWN